MQVSSADSEAPPVPPIDDLYRDNVDALFVYLARRLGRDLAGDLTAETFRIAIERLDRYDSALGSPRSWLFGIATNLLRRHWRTEERRLRALSRQVHAHDESIDPLLRVNERVDAVAAIDQLMLAVADLPAEDRDLLVLVAWEGCSHREVADILQIPMGTVRSRLHRVRAVLREQFSTDIKEFDDE